MPEEIRADPFTSKVNCGAVVLIPTLPVVYDKLPPVPDVHCELIYGDPFWNKLPVKLMLPTVIPDAFKVDVVTIVENTAFATVALDADKVPVVTVEAESVEDTVNPVATTTLLAVTLVTNTVANVALVALMLAVLTDVVASKVPAVTFVALTLVEVMSVMLTFAAVTVVATMFDADKFVLATRDTNVPVVAVMDPAVIDPVTCTLPSVAIPPEREAVLTLVVANNVPVVKPVVIISVVPVAFVKAKLGMVALPA